MGIPYSLEKHSIHTLSCPIKKLLDKDNPSLLKSEQNCFYPSSLCEQCRLSTETNILSSQIPASSEPMKIYPHCHILIQRKLINFLKKDVQGLAAILSEVQTSKLSAKYYDEKVGYDKKVSTLDKSGKLVPINGSVRTKERKRFSMVVDEHVSMGDANSTTRLLNILHSFPRRVAVSRPRKKLLILDINGILADVVYPPPKGYKADIRISGRAVFTRPYCRDFLKFCLERFQVGIWSSRSKKLVDRILDYLIGDLKERLTFCWDISQCTESQFRTLENRHKVMVFKELRMVWEKQDSSLPWRNGDYSELNTLLLDDSPYKALLNPPHTAVFPYSFNFKDHADNSIGPNGKIRAYLEEVAMAENVQEYIEKHPFGQSAITESSMSWEFYNKVLQKQYAATSMAARH